MASLGTGIGEISLKYHTGFSARKRTTLWLQLIDMITHKAAANHAGREILAFQFGLFIIPNCFFHLITWVIPMSIKSGCPQTR